MHPEKVQKIVPWPLWKKKRKRNEFCLYAEFFHEKYLFNKVARQLHLFQ